MPFRTRLGFHLRLLALKLDPGDISFWSVFGSHYSNLGSQVATQLERAVQAGVYGYLAESSHIFENDLPADHTVPLVAVEIALLLQEMGEEAKSVEVCHAALEHMSEKTNSQSIMQHLLSLMIGLFEIYAHGRLSRAIAIARDFRGYILNIPMEKYASFDV